MQSLALENGNLLLQDMFQFASPSVVVSCGWTNLITFVETMMDLQQLHLMICSSKPVFFLP